MDFNLDSASNSSLSDLPGQKEKIYGFTLRWTGLARKGFKGIRKKDLIPFWESWVRDEFWRWEHLKLIITSGIYSVKNAEGSLCFYNNSQHSFRQNG